MEHETYVTWLGGRQSRGHYFVRVKGTHDRYKTCISRALHVADIVILTDI